VLEKLDATTGNFNLIGNWKDKNDSSISLGAAPEIIMDLNPTISVTINGAEGPSSDHQQAHERRAETRLEASSNEDMQVEIV
jgi:hypothetical protein